MSKESYTFLRFFNSCLSKNVNIILDSSNISSNMEYQDFSRYKKLTSGYHLIQVIDNTSESILIEKRINLKPFSCFTFNISLFPTSTNTYTLIPLEEKLLDFTDNCCFIRIHNTSSLKQIPKIIVSMGEAQEVLIKKNSFGDKSRYYQLPYGTKEFAILDENEESILLKRYRQKLKPNRVYTFYIVGNGSKAYPFKVIRSIDGSSFLNLPSPQI